MANCNTTSPLLKEMLPTFAEVILFLRAKIGLKPDRISDGYMPATRVTHIPAQMTNKMVEVFNKASCSLIEAMCLINGRHAEAKTMANIKEVTTTIKVSPIICQN